MFTVNPCFFPSFHSPIYFDPFSQRYKTPVFFDWLSRGEVRRSRERVMRTCLIGFLLVVSAFRRTKNIPEFGVFYKNWGFYLEGIWLWRISGRLIHTQSITKSITKYRGYWLLTIYYWYFEGSFNKVRIPT